MVQISDDGDLVGLTEERKILQKTNGEPLDKKVINNRLLITTLSGIWIRDLQEENWKKIKVDEELVKFVKKGEKLFGTTHRGETIYSINMKDERKSEKVFDARNFMVWDMDIIGDNLGIATIDYSWEEMAIPQRR